MGIQTSRRIQHIGFLLLNSLLLEEKFIQGSGFTSELPIVVAATFPKFLKFWTLLVDFVEGRVFPFCYAFGFFEANFSCLSGICLGLRLFWTIGFSRFLCCFITAEVWPRFKMGCSVVVFGGQLDMALIIKAFR